MQLGKMLISAFTNKPVEEPAEEEPKVRKKRARADATKGKEAGQLKPTKATKESKRTRK